MTIKIEPSKKECWVLRRHYDEDDQLLLVDIAPVAAAYTTPLGEYSNEPTRQALVDAGLRERVERMS